MKEPLPRQAAFDLYWKFAAERHAIFMKRVAGEPSPWTEDAILRTYKFCNVFRAADRVSQYLIREIALRPGICAEDRLFQIVAFRTFSRPKTWEGVRRFLGREPGIRDLRNGCFLAALDHLRRTEGKLYTNAFILCATRAYGKEFKFENHVALFEDMFLGRKLASAILGSGSLKEIFLLLRAFPLMGDFMSYQTAIDLNYSDLLTFSENEFTQPGPGAMRGIRKAFTSLGDMRPACVVKWMVDRQEIEFRRLGLEFQGLWGRPLHAIDCQGLFCELDKYCREALPELKSGRTRIKSRFSQSDEQFKLRFPTKWGLNDKLPREPVLGIP